MCWAREPSRAPATAIQPRPGTATGREACSGESFGGDVFQAALAHVIAGEHGGQQAGGVARQRRARVGAVMGGNGSDDVVSATRIDRHSSGVLGCAKAAPGQDAGTSIPVARFRGCETGLSSGRLLIARSHEFPRPSAGCFRPALRRALAFLGFWVRAAPHDTPRIGRGSRSACTTESRRWKRGNRRASLLAVTKSSGNCRRVVGRLTQLSRRCCPSPGTWFSRPAHTPAFLSDDLAAHRPGGPSRRRFARIRNYLQIGANRRNPLRFPPLTF